MARAFKGRGGKQIGCSDLLVGLSAFPRRSETGEPARPLRCFDAGPFRDIRFRSRGVLLSPRTTISTLSFAFLVRNCRVRQKERAFGGRRARGAVHCAPSSVGGAYGSGGKSNIRRLSPNARFVRSKADRSNGRRALRAPSSPLYARESIYTLRSVSSNPFARGRSPRNNGVPPRDPSARLLDSTASEDIAYVLVFSCSPAPFLRALRFAWHCVRIRSKRG